MIRGFIRVSAPLGFPALVLTLIALPFYFGAVPDSHRDAYMVLSLGAFIALVMRWVFLHDVMALEHRWSEWIADLKRTGESFDLVALRFRGELHRIDERFDANDRAHAELGEKLTAIEARLRGLEQHPILRRGGAGPGPR